VHPAAGGDRLGGVADRDAVADHRLADADRRERDLVALRHAVDEDEARGQRGAGIEAALVGDDGDVVAVGHADGVRRAPRRDGAGLESAGLGVCVNGRVDRHDGKSMPRADFRPLNRPPETT
jgi:hypothetical protein